MIHRLAGALLLAFLLLPGCRNDRADLPMTDEQLVAILVDVHLAEAAIQERYGPEKDSLTTLYYDKIFAIHGINAGVFDSTMHLLRRDPGHMQRLYTQVLEVLAVREAGVQ